MINRILVFALMNRVLVLLAALALLVWGALSFTQLPIEAYPDVMNSQVEIITQWPGHAAEEVEQQMTVPIETALNTVPKVASLRSRSLFGLSVVTVNFEDGVDDYWGREQVLADLQNATLPTGVTPTLSPLASATGEIYRYTLTGAPVMELKTIEDWTLEREFKSVPGVADVNSFGGTVKQYQVQIDPSKLKQFDVTLKNVTDALTNGNNNAGGQFIELGSEEYVVRGQGLFHDTNDIGQVSVATHNGTPVKISDVARVVIGFQPRLGKVGWVDGQSKDDHDDAVQGIILLRRGENPDKVLEGIHKKVEQLNSRILPKGVKIHTFLDRTTLVHTTTETVEHNLIEGIVLVILILMLFLGNIRAAVIVAMTIPFGLFFAFGWMGLLNVPANLLSLGAIDFGVIVNGSVILVENVYRMLAGRPKGSSVTRAILAAAAEVQSEIFFTTLIIILAYLPLFTMQSVEKKMFSPMAYTIGLALVGSLIMALFVAPPLCYFMLRNNLRSTDNRVEQTVKKGYGKWLEWCLDHPLPVLVGSGGAFVLALLIAPKLGTEFLPHLDEGNLWIRATMPTTISYSEAEKLMPKFRAIMASYQPTKLVVSQLGRPDDGTDATGFNNAEFLVDLKPYKDWKGFKSKDELITKMNNELGEIPGVSFNFSQNIEDNVEEAVTGVKGELAVKLFGDDLDVLEQKATEIQNVLSQVAGVTDLSTFTETGEPQVTVKVNRTKAARYGIAVQDVEDVVQTAIGGGAATQLLDGEKKFDVVARLKPDRRSTINQIRNIAVSTPDGQRIPLAQVADITLKRGAAFVYREGNHRFIAIKFSIRGRDLGGAIEEAQKKVNDAVKLPTGYYTVWGGEFESMQRAIARLEIITPITLAMIFLVLYLMFNNVSRPLIVMMSVPMSLCGAIFALYFSHFHLSVSAAVGMIALFGIAVQNGVIIVSSFDHLRDKQGLDFRPAILEGAVTRLRPVLMTAMLATFGLIPAALSKGIGSDTQKPIAIVIIGGMIVYVLIGTPFLLPVLYSLIAKPVPMKLAQPVDINEGPGDPPRPGPGISNAPA
jgi:cobalt-zinc-cadmium resistance protein CzcA